MPAPFSTYTGSMDDRYRLLASVRDLGPSATLAINERCAQLAGAGRAVFRLGLGQSPFPVPKVVVEALRQHAAEKDYLPVNGLPALREAVARYHRRRHALDCSAEQVVIGPGSKQLLFLLQAIHAGVLLLPTPSWVTYAPQAHALGRDIVTIHTRQSERWRLTPEALAVSCRSCADHSGVLILNYPDNPTGVTYRAEELAALAVVARRYRLIVVADEIYGELDFAGQHVSMAAHYPEGAIVSAGLSKWCGAGGWRLGTFLFPRELAWLQSAMQALASESHSAVSAPVQFAAVRAYEGGAIIDRYRESSRRCMSALLSWSVNRLRAAGLAIVEPQGGFYFLADFGALAAGLQARGIRTSRELCESLLEETGVALLPGTDFGRADYELLARAACVDFDGARALDALWDRASAVDEKFLREHCAPVVEAIERLVAWCHQVQD